MAGKNPQEFCDEISMKFKQMSDSYNISYDKFIRTTSEEHKEAV